MADWPVGLPVVSADDFVESFLRPAHRSDTEAGYEITRPKWTRTRREFKVTFKSLTSAEVTTIEEFFEGIAYGGGSFNWTAPRDSGTYEVRLVEDQLDFQYVANDQYNLTVTFREV